MFGRIGEAIRESLRRLLSRGYIGEAELNEFLSELERNLIEADVELSTARELISKIRERALKEKAKLPLREVIIPIVYEELVALLGEKAEVLVDKRPFKLLLVGLFGSGKTTTAGKLALYYSKRGYKVALLCLDVVRPAAYEQLEQIAKKLNVSFLGDKSEVNPCQIVRKFSQRFAKYDIVIADSSGRDALNEEMIEEIKRVKEEFRPHEILLVLSADIGQQAKEEAQAFHEALGITGIIVTKLDGTAKGGGAIVACRHTNAKVKFVGTGEHLDEIEEFEPKKFVARLLGIGDLETLMKKVEETVEKEKLEQVATKAVRGEMNLNDLYEQIKAMQKVGPLNKLIGLIPGLSLMRLPKDALPMQEEKLKKFTYMIQSMTPEERENPKIINSSRIRRIARGAGVKEEEVKELLSFYNQMNKLMKMFGSQDVSRILKRLGNIKF